MRDRETQNITLWSFYFSSAKLDTFLVVAVFLKSLCGRVRFHLLEQRCVWAGVTTHHATGQRPGRTGPSRLHRKKLLLPQATP